jgi:hypothetical protein
VKAPTVHLNGTSKEHLLDAAQAALTATREARDKLQATYPNGRDYYPQGDVAHRLAVDEWKTLDEHLCAVTEHLTLLVVAISEQGRR